MGKKLDFSRIKLDHNQPSLLFMQLAEELQLLFQNVTMEMDLRLPSTRQLAEQLGINRKTVVKTYSNLLERGIIERKSPKILQVTESLTRKQLAPFPNIGIIIPRQFSSLFKLSGGRSIHYIKGIIDSAAEKNISTIMIQLPDFNASSVEINRFIEELTKRLIGVIHIGGRGVFPDRPLERLMKLEKLPQVMISAYPNYQNTGTVVWDPVPAVLALIDRFRAMNHQEIGFILRTKSFEDYGKNHYFFYAASRQPKQIRKYLEEYGFHCNPNYHCYNATNYQSVYRSLKEKVKNNALPTVYWCQNDDCANLALKALRELEIRVPEDVSLIGFDALPETSDNDELTTISLPFYSIGYKALNTLLDRYENGKTEYNSIVKVPASLVIKKTLARAKSKFDREIEHEKAEIDSPYLLSGIKL